MYNHCAWVDDFAAEEAIGECRRDLQWTDLEYADLEELNRTRKASAGLEESMDCKMNLDGVRVWI